MRVVKETLLIIPTRILAYCLMPNHWHFPLWPERDWELSEFMHQMTTTHVRRWHKAHPSNGGGHVYQGRFKLFPVESDEHFYTVRGYVERNPVRAGLVEPEQRTGRGVVRGHVCIQTIVVPYRCATGRYPVPKTGYVAATNP